MWKHIAANALTFLVIAVFLGGGAILWGQSQYSSAGPLERAICLRVEGGSTMRRVSQNLADEGAVSSAALFRISAEYSGRSGALKAGSFLIDESASIESIIEIITGDGVSNCGTEVVYRIGVTRLSTQVRELDPETNRFVEVITFNPAEGELPAEYLEVREESDTRYRVAVAEGVTSWQIVTALSALDVMRADVEEIPPEGSLAPDSYAVVPGMPVSEVVAQMTEAQSRILIDAWSARAGDVPLESAEEALILASIIEKETGVPEERGQVASVFVNRLRQGMRLQTDPTVIYGITGGEGILGRGLRASELRAATPYNTYVIEGLPPGPIANPGRASIEAALNPDETPYIFFVADGTGGHAFAVTLEDHNRNVAAWREIEAQRAAEQDTQ